MNERLAIERLAILLVGLGVGGTECLRVPSAAAAAPPDNVIMVGNDFENMAPADQVLEHWRFTKEQKDANYAVIRRSSDAFSGKAALELTLREDIPYVGDNSIEICPIFEGMSGGRGDCFLPPETDAVRVRIKAPEVGLSPRQARGSAGLCASHFSEGAIALAVELRSRHFTGALSRVAKSGGLAPEVGLEATTSRADY
jgi:hypothetical protein